MNQKIMLNYKSKNFPFYKTILFSVMFLLANSSSFGQTKSVKLYSNFLILNSSQVPQEIDHIPSVFQMNGISLGYRQITYNSKIHQVEGGLKAQNEKNDLFEYRRAYLYLRYEYGEYFDIEKWDRLSFSLSGGARVFYLNEVIEKSTQYDYPTGISKSGLNISIIGGLEYQISDRVYLETNFGFLGITALYNLIEVKNNNLPTNQQKLTSLEFSGLNERFLRLGLGCNL